MEVKTKEEKTQVHLWWWWYSPNSLPPYVSAGSVDMNQHLCAPMAQLNPPSFCRTSPHPLRFDADTMERRRSARGAAARWGIWGGQTTQEGSRWESDSQKELWFGA